MEDLNVALIVKPYEQNPFYWQVNGEPAVLLGGSVEDNLFQIPNLDEELALIQSVGGNYVRCTMSSRDPGNLFPFGKVGDKYDLNTWNSAFWDRFKHFLNATERHGIVVQV